MSYQVLIVEDEIKLANLLKDYLQQSSIDATIVLDGDDVFSALAKEQPDLMLLDIMLPNKDGITLCREIRQSESFKCLPIIMTTAKVDEIDRLLGLEIGADDYICKPYSPREVVARVKAILRRQYALQNPVEALSQESLILDDDKMRAQWHHHNLDLTAVEYTLLKIMFSTPGRIYSRNQLMDRLYNDGRIVSERTIDSHVKKLRQKIAAKDETADIIHSVYGVGYKFESMSL